MAGAETCQIYLIVVVGPNAREQLAAAFDAAPIASVLLRPVSGQKLVASEIKPLIEFVQRKGIAALVADDATMARTVKADGVHLSAVSSLLEDFDTAREIVGRGIIVGVDVGGSRHLAMELGEAGADYIAFGVDGSLAEQLAVEGEALDAELDLPTGRDALISWWSEIFEVPCVAFDIENAAEANSLVARGADFVTISLPVELPLAAVQEEIKAFAEAVTG
jgi:thiamine-phosphate pyrophosphorylase